MVTFPPKEQVAVLPNTPAVAQRMYDRVIMLSAGEAGGTQEEAREEGGGDVRLSCIQGDDVVLQVMRAVTAHFPVSQPGLLEPLVTQVARVLDNTATCFYFFW